MNVYTLMDKHKTACPDSHFFDTDTLKFFGERMSEMRVLKKTIRARDIFGAVHECYVLSSLQRNMGCTRHYSYFDTKTFKEVML